MDYITVGTDQISKIILGTDKSEAFSSPEQAYRFYDSYLSLGGNCFDTARIYSGGASERLLGDYIRQRGKQDFYVCTKGGFPDMSTTPPTSRLSYKALYADCTVSLQALGIDCIDLYWLHRDDPQIPAGTIIEALNRLQKAGMVRQFGASNWTARRINEANAYAASHGLDGFCASQIQWSAARTDDARYGDYRLEFMTAAEYAAYLQNGLPVFAYAPAAGGFFSKLDESGAEGLSEKLKNRFYSPENAAVLPKLQAFARQYGCSLSVAVLAYIYHNRLPGAIITGTKNPNRLRETFEVCALRCPPFDFNI